MKITIAKSRAECAAWTGTAVVIDVLRSSATLCALLSAGKKEVRIYDDKNAAADYKRAHKNTDFFSELSFEEDFDKTDNSPFLALKSSPSSGALLITTAGTPALMSLKNAAQIYMGSFCNFTLLAKTLKKESGDVLLVPSALFGFLGHTEDFLCAQVLADFISEGKARAEKTIADFKTTKRFAAFLKERAQTGVQDARIALEKDSLPILPQIKIFSSYALASAAVSEVKTYTRTAPENKKALVLFSGGLDSTVCLYWALAQGYECLALSVSYGQKHSREVAAAKAIAKNLGVKFEHITLSLPWLAASSLVGEKDVPAADADDIGKKVPSTYVPARNLLFVSLAASFADAVGAEAVVLGPNAVDYSGYPDCREEFYKPLSSAVKEGTVNQPKILTPLIKMSKAQIIKLGAELGVPFEKTWSCYRGGARPCGQCESCYLRAKGFQEAGVEDGAQKIRK